MMQDVARGIGDSIMAVYIFAAVSVFIAWPLAIWKLIDIGLWRYNNVSVSVK